MDPVREVTAVLMTNALYEGMTGQLSQNVRDAIYDRIE
jgi:hypothetical protein